jgi:hypothetical protein
VTRSLGQGIARDEITISASGAKPDVGPITDDAREPQNRCVVFVPR